MRIGEFDLLTAIQTNANYRRAEVQTGILKPTERLASGLRANNAADDAAALAIGARQAFEVQSLAQGALNASRTVSALQIADGALSEIGELLTRMQVLTLSATSENLSDVERALIDTEFQALRDEIQRVGNDTQFGGKRILGDSDAARIPFEDFRLTARINPITTTIAPNADLADGGALGDGDSIADGGEFIELLYTFRATENLTGLTFSNETLADISLGLEGGDTVTKNGTTVTINDLGNADGDGIVFETTRTLATATANVDTTIADDIDLILAQNTEGQDFVITAQLDFTDAAGDARSVALTFSGGLIGHLKDGADIPLRSVVDLVNTDPGDRDVGARIGSGILPDEDDIAGLIPDVTIDDLHFSLRTTDIRTQHGAERSFQIVEEALETLVSARADVGGQLSAVEAAVDTVRREIEVKTAGQAQLLAADIARDVTLLANGRTRLSVANNVTAQMNALHTRFSATLNAAIDAFGT